MMSGYTHLFSSEGYFFLLIMKIMIRFEVSLIFGVVRQKCLCYSEITVKYAFRLNNLKVFLFGVMLGIFIW